MCHTFPLFQPKKCLQQQKLARLLYYAPNNFTHTINKISVQLSEAAHKDFFLFNYLKLNTFWKPYFIDLVCFSFILLQVSLIIDLGKITKIK